MSEDRNQKPRLGDRKDLCIDITPSAVASYVQSYGVAFAGPGPRAGTRGRTITEAEAREELAEVLLLASVTYSAGERMTVRARVRRLEIDLSAECTRLTPDHIRCHLTSVRRLDLRRNSTQGRITQGQAETKHTVYDAPPNGVGARRKIGYLRKRTDDGSLEYRIVAEENGAPSPPWGPVPETVRVLALRDEVLARWLRKNRK